jgi:hypothetical protein
MYPATNISVMPAVMALTHDDCVSLVVARAAQPGPVKRTRATNYAVRLIMLHTRAQKAALKYGFVGVGCISYADAYLRHVQLRLESIGRIRASITRS